MLLNNQLIKEEITRDYKILKRINNNKKIPKLMDTVKAVLMGKCTIINIYIKKEKSQISYVN